MKNLKLPEVGQVVRVKTNVFYKDKREEKILEGIVSSILFSDSFQISYVNDETPVNRWFAISDVDDLEVL